MTRSILFGAVLTFGVLACGPGNPPGTSPQPLPPDAGAVVRIDNPSFTDFNIFVVWNGARFRLGRSTANTTGHFLIPAATVGEGSRRLRFIADPIGSRVEAMTHEIIVQTGDTVVLALRP